MSISPARPSTNFAFLVGGPDELFGVRYCTAKTDDRLAVRHHGGLEHFEATTETRLAQGNPLPVYRWLYRTTPAE